MQRGIDYIGVGVGAIIVNVCALIGGEAEIREPGKCSALDWFEPDDAPDSLTQISRLNLAHYLARAFEAG